MNIPDEALPLLKKYLGKLRARYGAYDYLDYALYKGMKGLRERTGIPELTLYWARHTFGSLARNECRMSVDDIGEALNHIDGGHTTTDIYLAKDWGIVDDVQFQVIKLLNDIPETEISISNTAPDLARSSMRLVSA
jgi:integrase